MESAHDYFKGKKVTVMGLGLLGRAIGDIIFLAQHGAVLTVTDIKRPEELQSSLDILKRELGDLYDGIAFHLGGHTLEDFRDRDFILKAAGVPFDSAYIAEARKNNVSIEMSASLFAALSGATIIGVTGTRGKTTVTHLLYEVIRRATETQPEFIGKHAFLGGNIKGVSTLSLLEKARPGDIAVLELDSWQLQGFGDRRISPHISVFTTFLSDHLNYYKGDLARYFADKANIFTYQTESDALIVGRDAERIIADRFSEYAKKIKAKKIVTDATNIPAGWHVKLPGEHNKLNSALAIQAAREFGINEEIIKEAVGNFSGVAGRLELLKELRGIRIYNDTTATVPDATVAALTSLGHEKNIVLIMGGADKQLDMSQLAAAIPHYCKAVALLKGTGTERFIKEHAGAMSDVTTDQFGALEPAVQWAMEKAHEGDIVILSPAFASFGMFKNEYDRGDQFVNVVDGLS